MECGGRTEHPCNKGDKMKGFESLQALFDGKTLTQLYFGDMYKLDDEKQLVSKELGEKEWKLCMIPYNVLLTMGFEEYIEYPLNYKAAIQQMVDGKIVESKGEIRYRLWGDGFQYWSDDYSAWVYTQVRGSWFKVVE